MLPITLSRVMMGTVSRDFAGSVPGRTRMSAGIVPNTRGTPVACNRPNCPASVIGYGSRWRRSPRSYAYISCKSPEDSSNQQIPMFSTPSDAAQAVADEVDDAGEVQLCGDALLNRVDGGQFGRTPFGLAKQALGLLEQPRIFQGHTDASGDGAHQSGVVLVERMLSLVVLEVDLSYDVVADDDRHRYQRFGGIGPFDDPAPDGCQLVQRPDDERTSGALNQLEKAARNRWNRWQLEANAVLVHIQEMHDVVRAIEPLDADVVRLEQHPQLVADEVDDRLERQPRSDSVLDGVDHPQHVTEMIVIRAQFAGIRPLGHCRGL